MYQTAMVSLLWLCVGVGCRKELPEPAEPECKVGCCYPKVDVDFAAKLNGALLGSIGREYISLKEPVINVKLTNQDFFDKEIFFALVCELDQPAYTRFNARRMSEPGYQNQQYRIWGALYFDPYTTTFNPKTKAYVVKIDRIEKVNP